MTAAAQPGSATGWYVYGVVDTAEAQDGIFDGATGIGGGAVTLIAGDGLAAIATEVALDEFGEEAIAENLRDPAWLESRVRAHEAVLEAALGAVTVVPFRFGTIYRNADHVRTLLSERKDFADAVERVRGRAELGVKGFLAAASEEAAAEGRSTSAGRRYLEEKQQARRAAEEREALKARLADESHTSLATVAEGARANALQPAEATGTADEMFLNGAYLVASGQERAFDAVVHELGSRFESIGVRFELTGPWPPYNFVEEPA